MQAAFSLRNVTYKNILSIPGLEIPAETLFGVTGKSGSGKTTLLKLLNNLISPDQGEICYLSQNLLTIDPVMLRRRVIMVPQSPYIFPGTVKDNIRLAYYFNRKDLPAQAEIDDLLSQFGMPGFINRDTFNMSGGEKQRLALVRALLLQPEALLLDEPTAALDQENAKAVVAFLADWARRTGKSVVMISHAGGLFLEYADTVLSLAGGEITELQERRKANV